MSDMDADFILDFDKGDYPYLEELNDGILKYITRGQLEDWVLDVGAGRGVLSVNMRHCRFLAPAVITR